MAKAKPVTNLTAIINKLPVRDQLALRFLGFMLGGSAALGDPQEATAVAYANADAFLTAARESWKAAKAQAEPADNAETADAQDAP